MGTRTIALISEWEYICTSDRLSGFEKYPGLKTAKKHMFRLKLAIQEYGGRMTISHREASLHMNAELLSHHSLPDISENPVGVGEVDIVEISGLRFVDLASDFFKKVA